GAESRPGGRLHRHAFSGVAGKAAILAEQALRPAPPGGPTGARERGRAHLGAPFRERPPVAGGQSRWATPSRSSSSSARVRSIRSREKSSISRPSTRLYSPPSVITGT